MLRNFARWFSTTIFAAIIGAIIGANIQKYLITKHLDEFLITRGPTMPDLSWLLKSTWAWGILGFSGGVALALWIVKLTEKKEPVLEIFKAIYGTQKIHDVTKELTTMIVDNKIETTIVYNKIKGDPDPGTEKILIIDYKYKGIKLTKYYKEDEKIIIP